jgi:MarR family transcriptional regulator for hemolysin
MSATVRYSTANSNSASAESRRETRSGSRSSRRMSGARMAALMTNETANAVSPSLSHNGWKVQLPSCTRTRPEASAPSAAGAKTRGPSHSPSVPIRSRAFNDHLAEAGGSVPVWLILSSLKSNERRTQLDVARAVGIEGPTLTRHLDGLEENGIVRRVRDGSDRRAVRVELTAEGERLFQTLRQAVIAFNRDLTAGLTETELERVRKTLARLEQNIRRP